MQERLRALHGVEESRLTDAAAARVPAASPAAPWTAELQAAVWWHPATAAAREQLAPGLRDRRALPLTVGALVRYRETPVGPYNEVLASPVLLADLPLPAPVVPFIAVDAAASVHGGRANWALPKAFARFTWTHDHAAVERGEAFSVRVEGEDAAVAWGLAAVVRPRPRVLPVRAALHARQPPPGGRVPVRGRATLRVASVDVAVAGPTLRRWLRAGRHPGVLLTGARASFGAVRG